MQLASKLFTRRQVGAVTYFPASKMSQEAALTHGRCTRDKFAKELRGWGFLKWYWRGNYVALQVTFIKNQECEKWKLENNK